MEQMMRGYPVGIQAFSEIIRAVDLYVDKNKPCMGNGRLFQDCVYESTTPGKLSTGLIRRVQEMHCMV
jgi:hypothetical protein